MPDWTHGNWAAVVIAAVANTRRARACDGEVAPSLVWGRIGNNG
jgi:hypothetical protein